MQPIGKVIIDITLDFVDTRIEAYVVPDEYLNTDLLVGQNVTEMPQVIVNKTSSSLMLYSDKPERKKIPIYNNKEVIVKDILSVAVRCDPNYTG